jgi:hypothetical protein
LRNSIRPRFLADAAAIDDQLSGAFDPILVLSMANEMAARYFNRRVGVHFFAVDHIPAG